MFKLNIDQSLSKATLTLYGHVNVTNAQETKEALLNAISITNHLCIDHTEVEEFDLSYLQLLVSLHKTADISGKKLSLIGIESDGFKSIIRDSGSPEYSWLFSENETVSLEEK